MDDIEIPGLADFAAKLEAQGADVTEMAAELERYAIEEHLPRPAVRGLISSFRELAARLHSRELVEDLGVFPASVEWLTLHAPRPGTVAIDLERSGQRDGSISLTLVAGVGTGRRISWSVAQSVEPQRSCIRFVQHFDVRVRLFQRRGALVERQIDVVDRTAREIAQDDNCGLCATPVSRIDEFEFKPLEVIDVRALESGFSEERRHEMTASRDVGVRVALPPTASGAFDLSLRSETTAGYTVKYEFAGGYLYRPHVAVDDPTAPPCFLRD